MSQQNETITQKTKIMKTLNINDIVRLTTLIKDSVLRTSQDFTLLSSGDRVAFIPCIFGEITTLKVYLNEERIETSRANFLTYEDISNVAIVRIIEKLDEKVSKKYNR